MAWNGMWAAAMPAAGAQAAVPAPAVAGVPGAAAPTPEQWAAAQWQQWAQWQEQYRQWQLQYGEKFAEQMAAYQQAAAAGAQPPLPPTNPAEARPPPPAGPPPQPAPQAQPSRAIPTAAVTHHAARLAAARPDSIAAAARPSPDRPTEEERQFDVQFRKWEEEFEVWKRQNVNHPDRTAYRDYERKFQAARAKLLERKEQMKAKRVAAARNAAAPPPARHDPHASDPAGANGFLSENSNFLSRPFGAKGIPGLDLAEAPRPPAPNEIVDITGEGPPAPKPKKDEEPQKPDLKAISKGINSILGDQKLLSMLSMVTQNKTSGPEPAAAVPPEESVDSNSNRSEVQNYQNNLDQVYKPQMDESYSELAQAARNYSRMPYMSGNTSDMNGEGDYYSQHQGEYSQQGYNMQGDERGYYSDRMSSYSDGKYDSNQNVDNGRPAWMDFPILEPYITVDYQHKPIKDFIDFLEPVQTFDYGHISKDKDVSRNYDMSADYSYNSRTVDYPNAPRYEDRYKEFSEARSRRNFAKERELERREERVRNRQEQDRNRFRDESRENIRNRFDPANRNDSRDKFSRRPLITKPDSPTVMNEKEYDDEEMDTTATELKNTIMIDDILESPGRELRPEKIVVILRGLPGSGKSYLAKLIKDREVENGGSARILSMDDYFMIENEDAVEADGRKAEGQGMKYEYDASMESVYINSLVKSLRRTISDGFFPFIIVDSINDQSQHFAEMESIGKQFGFKVYICEMDVDIQTCFKRNIHGRTMEDIERINNDWYPTPSHYTLLDATTLLQTAAIDHVQMEDVSDGDMEDTPKDTADTVEDEVQAPFSSKWDKMDDTDKLARLDGTSKPLRHNISTMEDFLQLDDWEMNKSSEPGKKTVRWADIEERRQQEKMRAIGFVVGQTDWDRMNDPTQGSSALTQTKYIERINRY